MATKKGLCPTGQYMGPNGKCIKGIPPFIQVSKPTTTTKVTETSEEKAERLKIAEQKRIANMSNKEFRQEKKGINRNVKVKNLKEGKEGRGGKIVTGILTSLASAVGIGAGIKGLLKKEKNGGAVNNKLKTIEIMKNKMQMGGVKKMQKGGSVDGPMEARRKIMGEKKPSLKKTLRYVKKNGSGYIPPTESNKPDTSKWAEKYKSPNAKKMQYGGSNMSLGPVTDFTKIPRPASTTTTTPAPAAAPAPTSVKEAREQARIAKINAKAKGYAEGTIVPGRNTGRLIDAGVEGARLVNNAMESRRNPGGMQNGGTILKKATMKPKMQNGGVVKELLNPLMFAPSRSRKVVGRESKKNDKNIKIYNKKKPDGLSPNEIKKLKGMTPPPIRNKMQMGGSTLKKANTGGGIPITARAAARKVAKGKGFMDYKYPSTDAPGTGANKGSYVKFGKDQASSPSGFKSLKGAGKSRPVRKMGGATKKK